MPDPQDIELGKYKEAYDGEDTEREALLPDSNIVEEPQTHHARPPVAFSPSKPRFGFGHLLFAFFGGGLACLIAQYALCGSSCLSSRAGSGRVNSGSNNLAPPYVGSTTRHHFPPTSPTNAFPSLFPTNIGFAGPTPTGAEPALIATAPSYPVHSGAAQLVKPPTLAKSGPKKGGYDLFKLWGNLSPYATTYPSHLENPINEVADGIAWIKVNLEWILGLKPRTLVESLDYTSCIGMVLAILRLMVSIVSMRLTFIWRLNLNLAQYGGPANFSGRLHNAAAGWNATGDLGFMNEWSVNFWFV
jgi:hypothetical protein